MRTEPWYAGALLLAACAGCVQAQEVPPVSPPVAATEATLADARELARLETPGQVFFRDGFESDSSLTNYFEIRGLDEGWVRLDREAGAVEGQGALRCFAPANPGEASGSGASYWFGPEGRPVVYFRRYLKFAADYDQGDMNHTGGGLAGVAGADRWGGMGKAGLRPDGTDRFTCAFEPWRDYRRYPAPGYMFLYTYWMDMAISGDGHYWGNFLEPPSAQRLVPERDRWYCLEQMVRVNDLGQANGELAAWIDGRLYIHYQNIRWRLVEDLRPKRIDFGIYIHQAAQDNTVWYDEVALSTGYIGPVARPATGVAPDSWGKAKSGGE